MKVWSKGLVKLANPTWHGSGSWLGQWGGERTDTHAEELGSHRVAPTTAAIGNLCVCCAQYWGRSQLVSTGSKDEQSQAVNIQEEGPHSLVSAHTGQSSVNTHTWTRPRPSRSWAGSVSDNIHGLRASSARSMKHCGYSETVPLVFPRMKAKRFTHVSGPSEVLPFLRWSDVLCRVLCSFASWFLRAAFLKQVCVLPLESGEQETRLFSETLVSVRYRDRVGVAVIVPSVSNNLSVVVAPFKIRLSHWLPSWQCMFINLLVS